MYMYACSYEGVGTRVPDGSYLHRTLGAKYFPNECVVVFFLVLPVLDMLCDLDLLVQTLLMRSMPQLSTGGGSKAS